MRLSESVRDQITTLALVKSVVDQFDDAGELPAGLAGALDGLRRAHDALRPLILEDAGVPVGEDGRMLLPRKIFRAWMREEEQMKSRVWAALPEGDLDAKAWLNCVLAAVEVQAESVPERPAWRRVGWDAVRRWLREVYREYDPELEDVEAMRTGVAWAEQIAA